MIRPVALLLATLVLAVPATGWTLDPIPGEERFSVLADNAKPSIGTELGYINLDNDHILQVAVSTELSLGPVGFGVRVPLNLRLVDNEPLATGEDIGGIIRAEDWDEPGDYLRVIRYVRLGNKRDFLYLRAGELAASIGHGTIMTRYLNNIDLNTFRLGLQFDVNTKYGGVETLISDVGRLALDSSASNVIGARGYIKPWAFIDADSALNVFALGTSVITDHSAPGGGATLWGMDLEAEVLHTPVLTIVPYTDLNTIVDAGWGWHLGVQATAKIPIGLDLKLPVRFEYRRFQQQYVPGYFSTFYEIERDLTNPGSCSGAPTEADPVPKLTCVQQRDGDAINGYYGDATFDFVGLVQLGAIYEGVFGEPGNLVGFVNVPALEVFQAKAYYERVAVTGFGDVFGLDERSMLIAEGRYEVIPFVYVVAQMKRQWAKVPDSDPVEYDHTDAWAFGVEAKLEL